MRPVIALFAALLLSACADMGVRADVTRFNRPEAMAPQRFTIVPDAGQVGSLEFQSYAGQVADALARLGWSPVAPGGRTDTVVRINWGQGTPEVMTWQEPAPGYPYAGWPYYGRGTPYPYWESRSVVVHPLWLSVTIATTDAEQSRVLFEGRATTEQSRGTINPVMPSLVRALFTNFPGVNGSTVRVVVPADQINP